MADGNSKMRFFRLNFLLVLYLFFFLNDASALNKYILTMPDGSKSVYYTETIGEADYVPLKTIVPVLFPRSGWNAERGEITFKHGILTVPVSSYFISFESYNDYYIAQLRQPTLKHNGELYVPIVPFFKAMQTLGFFQVEATSGSIWLAEYTSQSNNNASAKSVKSFSSTLEEENTFPKTVEKLNTKIETKNREIESEVVEDDESEDFGDNMLEPSPSIRQGLKNSKPVSIEFTNKPSSVQPKNNTTLIEKCYPPTFYVIPNNLIRKEIQEQTQDSALKKSKQSVNSISEHNSDMLFAANGSLFCLAALTQLIDISASKEDEGLVLNFEADKNIGTYQKAEVDGNSAIIRFPDLLNALKNPINWSSIEGIKSAKLESVRSFLVLRLQFTEPVVSSTVQRRGSKGLVYKFAFNKKAHSKEIPKEKNAEVEVQEFPDIKEDKPIKSSKIEDEKKKWALDVIVIDPGHGGKDPGAISVNGYKEKDLVLSIGKKLRDLIKENMHGTKVVMTRFDDTFIELYRRGQIANQNKGKLFISIHLNSTPKKPSNANGFETYILRPGRNNDAIRVANFENSVIKFEQKQDKYKSMSEEDLIVATMAQSAFVKLSELFARLLQDEVCNATDLTDRGVSQAGFYVLVGASMPNVLIEGAFLSNESDESFIISNSGQNKVAEGIFDAIKRYSEEYSKVSH